MKKYLINILILFVSFLFVSCEENFSPKTDYEEVDILYSAVLTNNKGDAEKISVIITKNYDVDGFDPSVNTNDPTITDAVVTLDYNKKTYTLNLDSTRRHSSSRYKGKQYYYSILDPLLVLKEKTELKVKAVLKNGKVLTSSLIVPTSLNIEYSYDFPFAFTTQIDRFIWGNAWTLYWYAPDGGHIYFPKLSIRYSKKVNDSTTVNLSKDLPITYKDDKPIYPSYTNKDFIAYDFSAIDRAIKDLSEGDPNKSNYTLISLDVSILDFSPSLANYYASTNGSLDELSVRLDEVQYTNIQGGLGVFGAYKFNDRTYEIALPYAKSFGYNVK